MTEPLPKISNYELNKLLSKHIDNASDINTLRAGIVFLDDSYQFSNFQMMLIIQAYRRVLDKFIPTEIEYADEVDTND